MEGQCNCVDGCKYYLKGGNCLSIVYKPIMKSELETKFNISLCSTQFRFRYANHKKYLRRGIYENGNDYQAFRRRVFALQIQFSNFNTR